mmetsp:Transcript_22194/g.58400  ORF Transcript_22194/g.58400 Transcript_22194/m.58400 type:complete len:207 (+) Transcript_22194:633-1253(+)
MSANSIGLARSLAKPSVSKSISQSHICPPGRSTRNASAAISRVAEGGSSCTTSIKLTTSAEALGKPLAATSARSMRTRPSAGATALTHTGGVACGPSGASSRSRRPTATKCGDRSRPCTRAARGKLAARRRVETPEPQPKSTTVPPSGQSAPIDASAVSNAARNASSPSLPLSGKFLAPTARLAISPSSAASQHRLPSAYAWKGCL